MRASVAAIVLLAGCAAASPAAAQALSGAPSASGREVETLPQQLGGFRRTGAVTDFERLPNGSGMGASVRYVPANGERMLATVYVYDRGRARQPEGGDGPDVMRELQSAAGEIDAMVRAGRYRFASPEGGMSAGPPSGPSEVRCANFRVVQQDGRPTGESAFVTVQHGSFVKVRATTWEPSEPRAASLVAAALIAEVRRVRAEAADAPPTAPARRSMEARPPAR